MVLQNSAARFKELVVHLWPLAFIARLQITQKKKKRSDVEVMKLLKILKYTAGLGVVTLVFNHRIPSKF